MRSKSLRERVTLATNTCSGIRQSYIIVRIALEYAFGAEYASPISKNSLCSKGVVHFFNSEARVQRIHERHGGSCRPFYLCFRISLCQDRGGLGNADLVDLVGSRLIKEDPKWARVRRVTPRDVSARIQCVTMASYVVLDPTQPDTREQVR